MPAEVRSNGFSASCNLLRTDLIDAHRGCTTWVEQGSDLGYDTWILNAIALGRWIIALLFMAVEQLNPRF